MAESSDRLVSCQPVAGHPMPEFGQPMPVGLSYAEALQARVDLRGAGFEEVEIAGLHGKPGRYRVEWPDPAVPGVRIPFYTPHEVKQAIRINGYLKLRPPHRPNDTRQREGQRKGQAHFFDAIGGR